MKKITILLIALLFAGAGFAQFTPNKQGVKPANDVNKEISSTKALNDVYLDYYFAEETFYGGPVSQGGYFDRFIWTMNMNYSMAAGDTNELQYCLVAFDSLYDPYSGITWNKNAILGMTVDTVWFEFGHENNSGVADTLRVKIISLDGTGYPNEADVLWSEDIIGTSISDTNQYNFASVLYVTPGLDLGTKTEFGVVLEYWGNRLDTAGFIAGYGDQGPCNTMSTSAYESIFSPNSFSLWVQYAQYGILPTSSGANIYYDCDGDGSYTQGIDGENFIQDIDIWTKVTIEDNIGIDETKLGNVSLGQNYPNPFTKSTTIDYSLTSPSNISLEVYDITGRQIMVMNEGLKATGNHKITVDGSSLNTGVYYYTLIADDTRLTKRMVIE